jgi:hypothetical protein
MQEARISCSKCPSLAESGLRSYRPCSPCVRARPVAVVEEEPELIVDQEVRRPPPLDKRIASVWIWTPTNNVTDGYDLVVSAAFGTDRVILKGDGHRGAAVEMHPHRHQGTGAATKRTRPSRTRRGSRLGTRQGSASSSLARSLTGP